MKKVLLVCLSLGLCFNVWAEKDSTSNMTNNSFIGLWKKEKTIDPVDDSTLYRAYINSITDKTKYGKPITLVVECIDNKTFFYIDWQTFISTQEHDVTIRIDKEQAFKKKWIPSTNYIASFYKGSPIKLLKRIINAKKVIAKVEPHAESPLTVTFHVTGAENALMDIRKQCKW